MYQIAEIIRNDEAPSHVNEISFHPSGSCFAATYQDLNEVRIFDSRTRKLLRVLDNPEAQLDNPHGVLFTEKHLLVSNGFSKPSSINVYRNADAITQPIQIFQTPFNHLREAHSLAIRGDRLVATYCENVAPSGAIVSYGFNKETGKITGLIDKTETWFSEYGDAKGVCFNADGTKIFVTFESNKQVSIFERMARSLAADKGMSMPAQLMSLSKKAVKRGRNKILQSGRSLNKASGQAGSEASVELEGPNPQYVIPTKNGLATFSISAEGRISRRPEQVIVREHFCRLENITLFDSTCVVTDLANHAVLLYDLTQDPKLTSPVQTVDLGNATPHGAKVSPDGGLLVVSSLGRKVVNQEVQWVGWESPREDKILVFERASLISDQHLIDSSKTTGRQLDISIVMAT